MLVLLLVGCSRREFVYDQPDGKISDMSWYGIEDGNFYDCDIETFSSLINQNKTVIIYIGYENCPWCRELCPVLNEFLTEYEFKAYYYDIESGDNGSSENLTVIETAVKDLLQTDEEGKPILYAPSIVYLREGKPVEIHEGTVNSHNARERKMTEREMERLRFNLSKEFEGLMGKYE